MIASTRQIVEKAPSTPELTAKKSCVPPTFFAHSHPSKLAQTKEAPPMWWKRAVAHHMFLDEDACSRALDSKAGFEARLENLQLRKKFLIFLRWVRCKKPFEHQLMFS